MMVHSQGQTKRDQVETKGLWLVDYDDPTPLTPVKKYPRFIYFCFIVCVYEYFAYCIYSYHMRVWCLQRPQEGFRSCGTRVTGSCEPPCLCAGN